MTKTDLTMYGSGAGPGGRLYNTQVDANFNRLMYWSGPWSAGEYEANEVVRDGDWLMIANKLTSDRPAPQASGQPSTELPDLPAFVEQIHTGVVHTAHEYELTVPGWINRWDIWAPELTADTNYRIIFGDVTDPDPNNHKFTQLAEPVLQENAWTSIGFPQSIWPAGTKIVAILDALNSGGSSLVTGGWTRAANSNSLTADPGSGAWGTNNAETSIRINFTDADTTDRTIELMGVVPGSTIQIVNTLDSTQSVTWTTGADPVNQGTHASFSAVTYDGPGVGGPPPIGAVCTVSITVPVPAPTKYEEEVGYFGANQPTWANVTSYKELSGIRDPATTNAYGIRMQFQPAYVSPDWDILAG